MDLSANYEATVAFLMQFRTWGEHARGRFYVDLRPLRRITPAAALLLVSEFDRWNKLHGRRLRSIDVDQWDEGVRALLGQMGFFELLDVASLGHDDMAAASTVFLQFSRGNDTDGKPIRHLREMIEIVAGAGIMDVPLKLAFFQGVSEAITNVRQHAYEETRKGKRRRLAQFYWMSASLDFAARVLTVMVMDHGVGIPKTLPLSAAKLNRSENFFVLLIEHLGVRSLVGFDNDAKLIEAAVVLGKSRTEDRFRGHGFTRDIQWLVQQNPSAAALRIHSNRGTYKFIKDGTGSTRVELTNRKLSLGGTFIEWQLHFDRPQLELNA